MNSKAESGAPRVSGSDAPWRIFLATFVITLAALWAYHDTLSVPLLYDDYPAVANNPTIQHLGTSLHPPLNTTARGRPVLNLSLALNYAASETKVRGYHVTNLAIHLLAGLALFGIVRRTLRSLADRSALPIALSAALLWTVHPLQTEAVTYIIQRAESLMGLFYLATLYCFIRAIDRGTRVPTLWFSLCIVSCLLGMGTKEVMASAPLLVLLYDRTFVAGSFRDALGRRWKVYASLAATWLLLASLVISAYASGASEGLDVRAPWWRYALTQLAAITHYIRLCFWPHPLVFDYGTHMVAVSLALIPRGVAVALLLAATTWALVRRPALGFLGFAFFAILAPTSSVIPVAGESMADYRMYLASIPVVVLVVLGIFRWMGRAALAACMVLAAGLLVATVSRNRVYQSDQSVWADTVVHCPGNERAHTNLGENLVNQPGRLGEAIAQFEAAVAISPDSAKAQSNLGAALLSVQGRLPEAISHLEKAVALNPRYAEAHNNLGYALAAAPGRMSDAISHYEAALEINPAYAKANDNLGVALEQIQGRVPEAIAHFEAALNIDPGFAEAHDHLGTVLASLPGRLPEGIAHLEMAVRIDPNSAGAQNHLGVALSKVAGRSADAITHFETAVVLDPDYAEAHFNLGYVLMMGGGHDRQAQAQFEAAIRLRPDWRPLVAQALASRQP